MQRLLLLRNRVSIDVSFRRVFLFAGHGGCRTSQHSGASRLTHRDNFYPGIEKHDGVFRSRRRITNLCARKFEYRAELKSFTNGICRDYSAVFPAFSSPNVRMIRFLTSKSKSSRSSRITRFHLPISMRQSWPHISHQPTGLSSDVRIFVRRPAQRQT